MSTDSEKAAYHMNFKVSKSVLISIVEAYKKRKYVEDLELIGKLEGPAGLLEALNSDLKVGISKASLDARTTVFGTHHKDPLVGEGFWSMVFKALEDFMLKLLIVCAIFSIAVDCGFNANDPEKL